LKTKVWDSIEEAIQDVRSGQIVLVGGFGLAGVPGMCVFHDSKNHEFLIVVDDILCYCCYEDTLMSALVKRPEVQNLTGVSNNCGTNDSGLGLSFFHFA